MINDNRKRFSKDCKCVDLACQSDHCGAPFDVLPYAASYFALGVKQP